jgi:hypothetical protein
MTLRTLPLDWLYRIGRKGYIVWSCVSGMIVDKYHKVVGPPPVTDALDRLARDIEKGM